MKRKLSSLSRRYATALRSHLKRKSPIPDLARSLGRRALSLGLETLDLARIHERALGEAVSTYSANSRDGIFGRAGTFFAEAIVPLEKTHRTARDARVHLLRVNESLRDRALDVAAANRRLKEEILRRKSAEEALRKSEQHYSRLLGQSHLLQEQLRHLSRELLSAQEEERKTISRELHDAVGQTLAGINIELASLKAATALDTRILQKKIVATQRQVEKAVEIVHRFARELRPSLLDELGLIPALHSFAKALARRTRLRISLKIFADVERLDTTMRTVLYRVAQEALTNVARHAQATRVEICIEKLPRAVQMTIRDDGKSFQVQRTLHLARNKGLGLLGMRERVGMVGGKFNIESAPGKGTSVEVQIPVRHLGQANKRSKKMTGPGSPFHDAKHCDPSCAGRKNTNV